MPRPLEQSYPVSLAIAIAVLVPYIVIVTASGLYEANITKALGVSRDTLQLITGLSEAGYAFGALLGGDFGQRFPQRPTWLIMTGVMVLAALLTAIAWSPISYGAGIVIMGLSTGMLVILSLPPVIRRFPPPNMPISAAFVNIGFFGASAAGPLIGGVVAALQAWRWFHGTLAAIGALAFLAGLFTLPDGEPPNRDLPFDKSGIALGLLAAPLLFFATSKLSDQSFNAPLVYAPLAAGTIAFIALLLTEAHKDEPLSPVKPMWSTFPVVGVLAAMFGGGAFISFVLLATEFLSQGAQIPPLEIGIEFAPQLAGALIGAILLSLALPRGMHPLLILSGILALLGGGVLLIAADPHGARTPMLAATGLLGYGAGATVSPGLYLASFSLPSQLLGRCFALVELMRAVADYSIAPVMRFIAHITSGGKVIAGSGFRLAAAATIALTAAAAILGLIIYLAGKGFALPETDISGWLQRGRTAIKSPPLGARLYQADSATSAKRRQRS